MENLEKICKPIIEYLKRNHNPYASIEVNTESITVRENITRIPLQEEVANHKISHSDN